MRIRINKDAVLISVIDQGIGIAPQDIEKITRPFYRSQNAYGIKVLVWAYHYHQNHRTKKKLSFQSVLGFGTTSIVEIPVFIMNKILEIFNDFLTSP